MTDNYIEEEMTIAEFADRFLHINNFDTNLPVSKDIQNFDIEIFGKNIKTGKDEYNKINKFVIKPDVNEYYTDGKLKGTDMHRVIENGKEIHLKDHPDFHKEIGNMKVVDFEVNKTHNYYANGRLNHNTEPCGKATSFHSSVKVRFATVEKLKNSDKEVIGTHVKATVTKNRMGPPFRTAEFDVRFDSGIADYASWIDLGKRKGIISGPSNNLNYDGQLFKTDEFIKILNENSTFKDGLYNKICQSVIMQYKSPNYTVLDDVVKPENPESSDSVIEEE